jgi:hypothetical protein
MGWANCVLTLHRMAIHRLDPVPSVVRDFLLVSVVPSMKSSIPRAPKVKLPCTCTCKSSHDDGWSDFAFSTLSSASPPAVHLHICLAAHLCRALPSISSTRHGPCARTWCPSLRESFLSKPIPGFCLSQSLSNCTFALWGMKIGTNRTRGQKKGAPPTRAHTVYRKVLDCWSLGGRRDLSHPGAITARAEATTLYYCGHLGPIPVPTRPQPAYSTSTHI